MIELLDDISMSNIFLEKSMGEILSMDRIQLKKHLSQHKVRGQTKKLFEKSITDTKNIAGCSPHLPFSKIKTLMQTYTLEEYFGAATTYLRFYFRFFKPLERNETTCSTVSQLMFKMKKEIESPAGQLIFFQNPYLQEEQVKFLEQCFKDMLQVIANQITEVEIQLINTGPQVFFDGDGYLWKIFRKGTDKEIIHGYSSSKAFAFQDSENCVQRSFLFSKDCRYTWLQPKEEKN